MALRAGARLIGASILGFGTTCFACAYILPMDGYSDAFGHDGGGLGGLDEGSTADAPPDCVGPACGETLTLGAGKPSERMIVIGDDVYWGASEKSIVKCAKGGCGPSPSTVVSAESKVWGFATDGSALFWTNDGDTGQVRSCPIAACAAGTATLASARSTGIAREGSRLFWAINQDPGSIATCSIPGCTVGALASGFKLPKPLAVGGGHVYWGAEKAILRCPVGGCAGAPESFFLDNDAVGDVVTDGNSVYWSGESGLGGDISKCPATSCNAGARVVLATGQAKARLATDGQSLYWTHRQINGAILKCAVSGCGSAPTRIAEGQLNPKPIAIDATHVYWLNEDGTLKRAPK